MSQEKLAKLMSKDKSLVRRVSDIEVDEITLTKKGALGDEADAVLLFKEDESLTEESEEVTEESSAVLEKEEESVKPEGGTEEVAELEKEVEEVETPEAMTVDAAVAFLTKEDLSDEQKNQIADLAIGLLDTADLGKVSDSDEDSTGVTTSPEAASAFPEEAMTLLKSISESIQSLAKPDNSDLNDEVVIEKEEIQDPVKEEEGILDVADQILRKSQDEKKAHGRAAQDAEVMKKLGALATSLSGFQERFENTQRTLDRACGRDA
jgi:hypothetical protein